MEMAQSALETGFLGKPRPSGSEKAWNNTAGRFYEPGQT